MLLLMRIYSSNAAYGRQEWNKLKCFYSGCSQLMGPDNGEVILNDPNHGAGAIAKYTCDPGYVPAGDTIRCCVRSQNILMWTGEDPTCVRKLHLVICRYMYIIIHRSL